MNTLLKKAKRYLTDANYRVLVNAGHGLYNNMPDKEFLELCFPAWHGYDLNLDNPTTFNEKMQWLKLYNRESRFTTMVDKYGVKEYISSQIGNEYVVPLLGVWEDANEIDINMLPDKFVLKTTHGCGGMFICRNKDEFDMKRVKKALNRSLKSNYYNKWREWPYKNVKPRIIAEEYMQNGDNPVLNVYKIFTFSGKPFLIQVIQDDKTKNESIDYFDTEWRLMDLRQNFPNSKNHLCKPERLEEMLNMSSKLGGGVFRF